MTKILDTNFLTPAQINELPCFTADRWLEKINESVVVIQCCQDTDNTSLVIIDFVLVGSFYFTPYVKILSVDGDTSYTTRGVTAPLALGHYKNPTIPINTQCSTFHGQVVFDFGQVISNFRSAATITFELGMIGQIPQSYGVSFPPQTPTSTFIWQKGVLPNPVSINYVNGNYNIVFEYKGDIDCSCSLQCVMPSGISHNVKFCPDESQVLNVYKGDLTADPSTLLIQLSDSIGNRSILQVQPLIGVKPQAPTLVVSDDPNRVEVVIAATSLNGTVLTDVQYQVIKYTNTANNYVVWKDWSSRPVSKFIDLDVIKGKTYGYAVRYLGKFGDMTQLSDWSSTVV